MSFQAIQTYQFQVPAQAGVDAHFSVQAIQLDTHCQAIEPEIARFYKVFWIEDGTGDYEIDFQPIHISGSGLFFLSPGQVLHVKQEAVKSGFQISFDREFYCIETHGKEIACNGVLFNNVHRASAIQLPAESQGQIRQLIDQMIQELSTPGPAHREMLETYLRLLLLQALRHLEQQEPAGTKAPEANQLVTNFIKLLEFNFREKHSVTAYAQDLGISPKSLTKRLHALGYPPPLEMIRDRILLQAKRDLRYTQKPIKHIAFELGFEDPAYFNRYFKKAVQTSPAQYRTEYLS